ncbi:hypothetical protein PG995_001799 [Apiospora arundinis]|uniref:Prefoldin subunit n=1 Tax=Apiospora arundinis TaxID=335852 RepID=A0ABR2J7N8_9PEZI
MAAQGKLVSQGRSLWSPQGAQAPAQALSRLTTTRRHRSPFLSQSPKRVLGLWLQRNDPEQRKRYGFLLRSMARMKNERLPLITLQKLMRKALAEEEEEWEGRDATASDKSLSPYAGLRAIIKGIDPRVWQDQLNSLAANGWDEEKLDHLVWILSADTADARIERFVSSNSPKPVFLLGLLLHSDQRIREPKSLRAMIDYIQQNHTSITEDAISSANLEVTDFIQILERLTRHAQRLSPSTVEEIGHLTRWYIQSIPLEAPSSENERVDQHSQGKPGSNGYHKRCFVFNSALDLLSRPAPMQPLLDREFNWNAQRLLLHMSDTMARPLVIEKSSYAAIRKVMVGLKKSSAERWVAMRYSKSWPPYRQDFDGHDTKRTHLDDQSRSVKAGSLMTEAGYAEDDYDRALGALGGMTLGSPTVQTRSQPPKEWKDDDSRQNFYTMWAMKIRSTRNAQEAWRQFNTFTNTEPNLQVYTEMFLKLQPSRSRVEPNPQSYPGDGREVSPVHEANFSEYELARLTPPDIDRLYTRMINHNIKPNGTCLQYLVSNASTVEQGLEYLRDSPLDPEAIKQLEVGNTHLHFGVLKRIPLLVFSSYVQLLCNLQPNRGNRQHRQNRAHGELHRVRHAIELVKTRLRPNTSEWASFRPVWQVICRTLARPYVAVLGGSELANAREALHLLLEVHELAERAIGPDTEIFLYMCRALQKVVMLQYPEILSVHDSLVEEAHRTVTATFKTFSLHVSEDDCKRSQSIGPVHLHTYMRTLAILGDLKGRTNLMHWILRFKNYFDKEAERSGRGQAMLAKTLCAFEAFTGPMLQRNQRARLESSIEDSPWRWPTEEEVQDYIESDTTGVSQKLYEEANGIDGTEVADNVPTGDHQMADEQLAGCATVG